MADLHRAGRYDRMSDGVLTLTGQVPLSVQQTVEIEHTRLREAFERMSREELEAYARDGVLPEWSRKMLSVSEEFLSPTGMRWGLDNDATQFIRLA